MTVTLQTTGVLMTGRKERSVESVAPRFIGWKVDKIVIALVTDCAHCFMGL